MSGLHIQNEVAYENAIRRNIIANARKTFERTYEDAEQIIAFVESKGFQGGQYPDTFIGSMCKAFHNFGKLTEKQVMAIRNIMEKQEENRKAYITRVIEENAKKDYLANVGEKIRATVTVKKVFINYGFYGVSWFFVMEDESKNVVVYKGTAQSFRSIQEGDEIIIEGKVKENSIYKEVKQNVIERAKVIQVVKKAEVE